MTTNKMIKAALVATVGGVWATACFADATWNGYRYDANVDWSLASNWTGDVPTGNATATVAYNDTARMLTMTPPLDFTGTIVCGGDNRAWAAGIDSTLRLNVLEGSSWTVGHCSLTDQHDGTLVATAGLADRIGSTFTGMVVIPKGVSFTAHENLNDAVEFAGDGELTLTKAAQLAHVQAFAGTVSWAGGDDLSPEDTSALQRHTVRLADGQSLTLPEKMLSLHAARAIPDFTQTESWSFNGGAPFQGKSTAYTFDATPPHVNEAGKLELMNDCGQKHSVVFKDRKFGMCDTWGVHFTLNTQFPDKSKYAKAWATAGFFGVYLVPATDSVSTTDVAADGPIPPAVASGFCVDMSKDVMLWQKPGDVNRYLNLDRGGRTAVGGGLNFIGTVELDVTFTKGVMIVVARQGDNLFAFRRTRFDSAYTRASVPDGYYLAIGGSGVWNGDGEVVAGTRMTLSNFSGWYRSREAGAWATVENASDFYPITAEKWYAKRYLDSASEYVQGADAIESDGSFLLQPEAKYRRTLLGCETALNTKKRYLLGWNFVGGSGEGSSTTEHIKFGMVTKGMNFNNYYFGYNYLINGRFDDWTCAYAVDIYPYGQRYQFQATRNWWTSDGDKFANVASGNSYWPLTWRNETIRMQYLYDGDGGFYLQAASKTGAFLTDQHYIPAEAFRNYCRNKGSMKLCFENGQSWGYTTTAIKDLTVQELTGNSSPYLSGVLEIPASATVTVQADAYDANSTVSATQFREVSLGAGSTLNVATAADGSRVALETLRIAGSGAKVAAAAKTVVGGLTFEGDTPQTQAADLSGDVTFAEGVLTLTVPDAWRRSRDPVPLFKGAPLPAAYRVVTDAGRDVSDRISVSEEEGVLLVRKGLFVIVN